MDCRVKPGNDAELGRLIGSSWHTAGIPPRMRSQLTLTPILPARIPRLNGTVAKFR
jgi:hypothetical protein